MGFFMKFGGVIFRKGFCFSLSRSGTRANAQNEMKIPTNYMCLYFHYCSVEGSGLARGRAFRNHVSAQSTPAPKSHHPFGKTMFRVLPLWRCLAHLHPKAH